MSEPAWNTLVEPAALMERLRWARLGQGAPIVLLDVRHDLKDAQEGLRRFREGHLPGAVHAHVDRDLSSIPTPMTGRHPLPDVDDFIATASRWGIDSTAQVVAYDDWGGAWASRAWWLLRYYGHEHVAVLNGGVNAWRAAGGALEKTDPPVRPRAFRGRPGAMPTVTTWELTTRAPRCLVDARAPERYRGDVEPVDPVAGHIPYARNVPFSQNTDKDGNFLAPDVLRAKYLAALDGLPPKDAAFYCGSGVTAPHDILAMHIAGLPGAALYPGSWSEWIRNPMRPVVKGDG